MFRNSLKMLLTGGKSSRKNRSSDGGSEEPPDRRQSSVDSRQSRSGQGGISTESDCAFEPDYAVPPLPVSEGDVEQELGPPPSVDEAANTLMTRLGFLLGEKVTEVQPSDQYSMEVQDENQLFFEDSIDDAKYCGRLYGLGTGVAQKQNEDVDCAQEKMSILAMINNMQQ